MLYKYITKKHKITLHCFVRTWTINHTSLFPQFYAKPIVTPQIQYVDNIAFCP